MKRKLNWIATGQIEWKKNKEQNNILTFVALGGVADATAALICFKKIKTFPVCKAKASEVDDDDDVVPHEDNKKISYKKYIYSTLC